MKKLFECPKCHHKRAGSDFFDEKGRALSVCQRCHARRERSKMSRKKRYRRVIPVKPGKAWCSSCQKYLPRSHFTKKADSKTGTSSYCKQCAHQYHRGWFQKYGKEQRKFRKQHQDEEYVS